MTACPRGCGGTMMQMGDFSGTRELRCTLCGRGETAPVVGTLVALNRGRPWGSRRHNGPHEGKEIQPRSHYRRTR